eukprot:1931_1
MYLSTSPGYFTRATWAERHGSNSRRSTVPTWLYISRLKSITRYILAGPPPRPRTVIFPVILQRPPVFRSVVASSYTFESANHTPWPECRMTKNVTMILTGSPVHRCDRSAMRAWRVPGVSGFSLMVPGMIRSAFLERADTFDFDRCCMEKSEPDTEGGRILRPAAAWKFRSIIEPSILDFLKFSAKRRSVYGGTISAISLSTKNYVIS